MKIYKIYEKLKKSKKAVFTINEIRKISGIPNKNTVIYVNRMIEKKLLTRIERNKYTISDNIFVNGSQIFEPCYLSFNSGLYLHKQLDQIINIAQIVSPRNKKSFNSFQFIKIKPNNFFGYSWIEYENSYILLGDIEKIILDILYLPKYSRIQYAFNAIDECDIPKILKYVKKMENIAVKKRIGYLLELKGIKTNLYKNLKNWHKLNPNIKNKGKYNKKWKMWINEEIK
jgi:predicted transcriptional regulator of viral defense system